MIVPWLDLPNEVWELILGHLNVRSLLRASETCRKFNDVMGNSMKLMKMIRLCMKIPGHIYREEFHCEQGKLKSHRMFKVLKENLLMSGRHYQNFGLSNVSVFSRFNTLLANIIMEICEIIQIFSECIIDLRIQNSSIEKTVFKNIISKFRNVQKCVLENSQFSGDDDDLSLELPKLEHISMLQIDLRKIENVLFSFENLKSLEITSKDYYYIHIEEVIKNLLLRQKKLKVLKLTCSGIFGHNISPNTEFCLESLSLKCSKWKNMDYAESFFKKQKHLKDLCLKLNDNGEGLNFRYNDILKDIFSLNQNLTEISIEMLFKIENVTFLDRISLPKVKTLSFRSYEENNELFSALVIMCPNVRKLTFKSDLEDIDRAAISTLVELESLKICLKTSIHDLVICSKRFSSLTILEVLKDDDFVSFLRNHQSIEHLIIQKNSLSHQLCKHIVNYLPNLRSFDFYRLETPTETLRLILTLKYLRCLNITCYWNVMNQQVEEICTSAGINLTSYKSLGE